MQAAKEESARGQTEERSKELEGELTRLTQSLLNTSNQLSVAQVGGGTF